MVRESLARRFRPAGFEQPEGSRHRYTKPRRELQEAFNQWVYWADRSHDYTNRSGKARELIQNIGEIHADEATSLLAGFEPTGQFGKYAGLFISACYNRSPEQVIIFDMEREDILSIGIELKRGKILVNNGKAGKWFGAGSYGIVINNNRVESRLCHKSSGIGVNNGETGDRFGFESTGTVFNAGETGGLFAYMQKARFLTQEHL